MDSRATRKHFGITLELIMDFAWERFDRDNIAACKAARTFDTPARLVAYLAANYPERMERYAARRACGESFLPAFAKSFIELININRYDSRMAMLEQEMDASAGGLIRRYVQQLEVRPGVGIFMNGKPVWTEQDSERGLFELLEKQARKEPGPSRRKMEREIAAELSAIRGPVQ
jgi:hypothetical protein